MKSILRISFISISLLFFIIALQGQKLEKTDKSFQYLGENYLKSELDLVLASHEKASHHYQEYKSYKSSSIALGIISYSSSLFTLGMMLQTAESISFQRPYNWARAYILLGTFVTSITALFAIVNTYNTHYHFKKALQLFNNSNSPAYDTGQVSPFNDNSMIRIGWSISF